LIAMVAALSALNALSIDVMLPALPDIGRDFELVNDNDRQLVIVFYMAAFGVAQLAYGPLSDASGRRGVLLGALGIYVLGALMCTLAPSYELFLAARALQGIGAAATRVTSSAVVRDLTSGRRMAQIMSTAMTLFMIIPIIAPSLGQLVLFFGPWRWIFAALTLYALAILTWMTLRLPETLAPENRRELNVRAIVGGYREVLRHRQTVGYMIASAFLSAGLFGYVTASEQLYVEVFHLGDAFAVAFAVIAVAISIGNFVNSRLVVRLGMRRISQAMTLWFIAIASAHALFAALGFETLWSFLILLSLTLGAFGLIAGNLSALAMEPVGHVAGSASALFGAVTALGAAFGGGLIARAFNGTALPFLLGLTAVGVVTFVAIVVTERGKLFVDTPMLASPKL